MLEGSCLCGEVTYQVDCEPQPYVHCHCRTCRKAHGSAFSSVMGVPKAKFKWTKGEENLSHFESSPGKVRCFCQLCGSQIIAQRKNTDLVLLRMGCLDTEFEDRANLHIWRSDSASWYDPAVSFKEIEKGED